MCWKHTFFINECRVVELDQWIFIIISFDLWMVYNNKTEKWLFSQYTEKKKKRSRLVLFSFLLIWECFPLVRYSTYSSRCARGFIIKVKPVEIWPDSTVTITIPPASASLFITIMRISISGTKNLIPVRTEGIKDRSLICFKKKKRKRKSEKNQHWDHANAFEASSLMFVTKQTNVQTKQNKKTKRTKNNQNKTQFKL